MSALRFGGVFQLSVVCLLAFRDGFPHRIRLALDGPTELLSLPLDDPNDLARFVFHYLARVLGKRFALLTGLLQNGPSGMISQIEKLITQIDLDGESVESIDNLCHQSEFAKPLFL